MPDSQTGFYCKVSKSGQTVYIKPSLDQGRLKPAPNGHAKIPKQPKSKPIAKLFVARHKSGKYETPLLGQAVRVKDLVRESALIKKCRSGVNSPTK